MGGSDQERGAAGSRLQIQVYVNKLKDQLEAKIREVFTELAKASFDWRSPRRSEGYREYWDRGFLEAVDQAAYWPELNRFWPAGGPHWDALAVVLRPGRAQG